MKVCAKGAQDVSENQALSSNPVALATECAKAIKAGTGAVHAPRNQQGEENLSAPDVTRWVGTLRQHCSNTPTGVTTGAGAMPDVATWLHEIDAWQKLPDFASMNWHEDEAHEVAAKLLERGIGVEAGI